MTEPFLGEIHLFGFNFAARGYAICSGQIIGIAQNSALFSLLGTYYGGNGQTTFALPDLRGRLVIGQGQGPATRNYQMGDLSGSESVTLLQAQMPTHSHSQPVTNGPSSVSRPRNAMPAAGGSYAATSDGGAFLPGGTAGSNLPFDIVQPYLVMNYCIALEGIFPSRN